MKCLILFLSVTTFIALIVTSSCIFFFNNAINKDLNELKDLNKNCNTYKAISNSESNGILTKSSNSKSNLVFSNCSCIKANNNERLEISTKRIRIKLMKIGGKADEFNTNNVKISFNTKSNIITKNNVNKASIMVL